MSALQELHEAGGLDYLGPGHELRRRLDTACKWLRQHLLSEELEQDVVRLSEAESFWELTPKYRYDLLNLDIPSTANQLAFSVWLATLHVDQVSSSRSGYFPTWSDVLFWYHVDFGVRLASSAWDRTALLLDLAFKLESRSNCSLPTVLRMLPKSYSCLVQDASFRALKKFRDGRFTELEAQRGAGARHETTHLMGPATRHLAEFVEAYSNEHTGERTPADWIAFLQEHHDLYLAGLRDALDLIEKRWPSTGGGLGEERASHASRPRLPRLALVAIALVFAALVFLSLSALLP